ncbi:MAG TPA: two-component sensor histidine kinase, partial [Pelotomaculum sp.]|nr:two-component sensor histidine kinase [Pelotomaculum sp.]
DRMSKLINNLLTLARFDDTELVTQSISFNLGETVQSVILSMEAPIAEKGIELSVSIEPDIFIKSDAEGLKQVVTILLDNAIKYTDQNGQIDVALTRSNHQAEFSIKNSGKGIPKQEIPKIFDRFYRADHSRTHES